MPELPEVETTRRGLAPLTTGRILEHIVVRHRQLRWPVAEELSSLAGHPVMALERRSKWLLWRFERGTVLWHLGMSGSFRGWMNPPDPGPHDHIDVQIEGGHCIRYTDPRRFGAVLWQPGSDPMQHARLRSLGPEPLEAAFSGDLLWQRSRGRKAPIKNFIMDGRIVVGVGNIYAAESLFEAGIHPRRAAGRISRARYQTLASVIRQTLARAIDVGGTSLRDFTVGDGTPGYFGQELKVYGRAGQPCLTCSTSLKSGVIGQRSTVWCPKCQR